MDIVFNINPLGLEGLGATLKSLIRNCSDSKQLRLLFLCSEFGRRDKFNIDLLLNHEKYQGTVAYIDFDAKEIFGHLLSLHGNWTTYGRLLISKYVQSDTALYLDSDLVILLDVLSLDEFDFDGAILAAVYGSSIEWVIDKNFFVNQLKWNSDQKYFNAGVLLFNLKKWRESDIDAKWKTLAEKYPEYLVSHDQTLLNAICEGNFAELSSIFNNPWYPGSEEPEDVDNADKSIIHFVGSPKPWDLFAGSIHKGNKIWSTFNTKAWKKEYGKITIDKLKRTWKIRRSIVKLLKKRILKEKEM